MSEAKNDETGLSAVLCGVGLTVNADDSFSGKTILNSRIFCNFKTRPDNYAPERIFEIGKMEDFYSDTFLKVFKGSIIEGCIIEGTDT